MNDFEKDLASKSTKVANQVEESVLATTHLTGRVNKGGVHHAHLSTRELEQFVEHITQLRRSFMGALENEEEPIGWRFALEIEGLDLSFRVGRLLDRIAKNSMGEVKDNDIQFALMVRQLNAWIDLLNVMNNRVLED